MFIYLFLCGLISWAKSDSDDYGNTKMFFPTITPEHWEVARSTDIRCDEGREALYSGSPVIIPGLILSRSQVPDIEGFLCTKQKLITICSKGFFGGTSIDYQTLDTKITRGECQDAIDQFLVGDVVLGEHKPPVCSWMKTSSTYKIYITVRKYKVKPDPYFMVLRSSIFKSGQAPLQGGLTVYQNKYWIPIENGIAACSPNLMTRSYLALKYEYHNFTVWSPDIPDVSLYGVCIEKFCGENGWLFPSGHWIQIKKTDIPKMEQLGEYLYDMKECTNSRLIVVDQPVTKSDVIYARELSYFQMECEKTREMLLTGAPINRIQLQTISHKRPGLGNVFLLRNGTLYVGKTQYTQVKVSPEKKFPFVSFHDNNSKQVIWKEWLLENKTGIYDGPNGMFIKGDRFFWSLRSLSTYSHFINFGHARSLYIDHKASSNTSDTYYLTSDVDSESSDDESLSTLVIKWSLGIIGMSILMGGGGYGFYIGLLWYLRQRKEKLPPEDSSNIELY